MAVKAITKLHPGYVTGRKHSLEWTRAKRFLGDSKKWLPEYVEQYAYVPLSSLDIENEIVTRIARRNQNKSAKVRSKLQQRQEDQRYRVSRRANIEELKVLDRTLIDLYNFTECLYPTSKIEPIVVDVHNQANLGIEPILNTNVWLYQDTIYQVTGTYTDAEKKLLILDFADRERQQFERLKAKFSKEQMEHIKYQRIRIPENVRIEVWRRDEGKCAGCGSRENLEYDHIVPVTRGGSNTARNVEWLCAVCNRSKGDRIQ